MRYERRLHLVGKTQIKRQPGARVSFVWEVLKSLYLFVKMPQGRTLHEWRCGIIVYDNDS